VRISTAEWNVPKINMMKANTVYHKIYRIIFTQKIIKKMLRIKHIFNQLLLLSFWSGEPSAQ